ncbi:YqgE/AlgH family protein [Gluconobacter sphaericus]|uniref:YqgE/AlgH family protein n=1 Tax=Gluconobacter sphaericus TaxID=574987 RepID=UPI001920FDE1|nr:YqgE/AlgH family protein [Gluconobacter sphaericus]MBS1098269.1 YqgE/AlgH family protein [Gluconobacter sphaericus]QQX90265.1 YqgE/AlgH family protein [Gluconobacter sphaericus]
MKKTLDGRTDNLTDSSPAELGLTGKLLVAAPALAETFFERTVIYVCAHSLQDGAMGLIVNRRLSQPGLDDLFAQLGIEPNPPERRIGVCMGGPVEHSRGFVLHSADWAGEGSLDVDGQTSLTASLDILRELATGQGPKRAMMALGHAAWSSGQLEQEILRDSSWFVAPAMDDIVFGTDHARKWRKALEAIDIDPLLFSASVGEA